MVSSNYIKVTVCPGLNLRPSISFVDRMRVEADGRQLTEDVERIDHIREEAYNTGYSEAEAQRASTPAPGKTLPQLLEQLDAGECKGIKSATAYKIAEFAREQGYLE